MRTRPWSALWATVLILGWSVCAPLALDAQGGRRTVLTITGFPFTVTGTTPANFDAGSVTLGTITFQVDATANNPNFSPRATTVNVRCFAPCPATGTLAASGLQWRRGDLGAWNPLTTTFTFVEARTLAFNGANDPWSNTIQFRYALGWTTAPPTPATQFQVQLQLVVAAP